MKRTTDLGFAGTRRVSSTSVSNGMKQKPRSNVPLCVYCGTKPGVTVDHVVPKALYPKPKPPERLLIKVPACRTCNEALAQHQDYLRDWLVLDYRSGNLPPTRELFEGPFTRSARRNQSKFLRDMNAGMTWEPKYSPSGRYQGHALHIPLNEERLEYIMRMMVRGLYYHLHQTRLPDDIVMIVNHVHPPHVERSWKWIKRMRANGPIPVGRPDVFSYGYLQIADEPHLGLWWLQFYEKVIVSVVTMTSVQAEKHKVQLQRSIRIYGHGQPQGFWSRLRYSALPLGISIRSVTASALLSARELLGRGRSVSKTESRKTS